MDGLPVELTLQCLKYLKPADLASLACVSKTMNKLVLPLLWTDIMLQPISGIQRDILQNWARDIEEGDNRTKLLSELEAMASRYPLVPFSVQSAMNNPHPNVWKALADAADQITAKTPLFLQALVQIRKDAPERWDEIAKIVRGLSLSVSPYNHGINGPDDSIAEEGSSNCFDAIADLSGLEILELTAEWSDFGKHPLISGDHTPMRRLRKITLKYFVPVPIVTHFIATVPENITHLGLFLLAPPVGHNLGQERRNAENIDPDDDDMAEAEAVAPRSLCWMPADLPSRLTSLTHLSLRKPSETSEQHFHDIYHQDRADRAALREWAGLIRSTRSRLVELVLEQRPVIDEIRLDTHGKEEHPRKLPDRPGDARFSSLVLPALMEPAEWPCLKKLVLKEIQLYGTAEETNLAGRFDGVEVRLEDGYYMFLNAESGTPGDGGMGNSN